MQASTVYCVDCTCQLGHTNAWNYTNVVLLNQWLLASPLYSLIDHDLVMIAFVVIIVLLYIYNCYHIMYCATLCNNSYVVS